VLAPLPAGLPNEKDDADEPPAPPNKPPAAGALVVGCPGAPLDDGSKLKAILAIECDDLFRIRGRAGSLCDQVRKMQDLATSMGSERAELQLSSARSMQRREGAKQAIFVDAVVMLGAIGSMAKIRGGICKVEALRNRTSSGVVVLHPCCVCEDPSLGDRYQRAQLLAAAKACLRKARSASPLTRSCQAKARTRLWELVASTLPHFRLWPHHCAPR
jgi:hypothetical protein